MTVCRLHGGSARHVKAAAEKRLRRMVAPVLGRLFELAMQDGHRPAAVNAARDLLDRSGIGELVDAKVRTSQRESTDRIVVNIGFLSPPDRLPE